MPLKRIAVSRILPVAVRASMLLFFLVATTHTVAAAEKEPAAPWKSLFDGQTLGSWKKTPFGGEGEVEVKDGRILIAAGNPMSGISWKGEFPKIDYEISLEAMRASGSDFFCGLTFPVGDAPCSFICGGWGGGVVGLSSIDGSDASENETTKYQEFETGRWYKIRARVSQDKIETWIDDKQMVDLKTKDRRISIRIEVEPSRPLGHRHLQHGRGAARNQGAKARRRGRQVTVGGISEIREGEAPAEPKHATLH